MVAKLEERIVPLTKFHYPTLIIPKKSHTDGGCTIGVMYTIGMKEQASEGGVRSIVLNMDALWT